MASWLDRAIDEIVSRGHDERLRGQIAELVHEAKHRTAAEWWGEEPGCDRLGCPTSDPG